MNSQATLEVLKKTKEWFSDEHHWTKQSYAKNSRGNDVSPSDPDVAKTCLAGAFRRFAPDSWDRSQVIDDVKELTLACGRKLFPRVVGLGHYVDVTDFNDAKGVGIAKVRKVVDCAIDDLEHYGMEGTEG